MLHYPSAVHLLCCADHREWPLLRVVLREQQFYKDSGNRGEGKIGNLPSLPSDLDGSKLVIYDGTGGPGRSFIDETLAAVGVNAEIEQISSPDQIVNACPGSLSSVSACFGAIYIDSLNEETGEMVRQCIGQLLTAELYFPWRLRSQYRRR